MTWPQKPNTVLPDGAVRLSPPTHAKIGSWREGTYDAALDRHGIRWLRCKGGFGKRGDREDWVADVPGVSLNVSRWRGENWRAHAGEYAAIEEAIDAEVRIHARWQPEYVERAEAEAELQRQALAIINAAVEAALGVGTSARLTASVHESAEDRTARLRAMDEAHGADYMREETP